MADPEEKKQNGSTKDTKSDKEKLTDEVRDLVEDMDDLADDIGFGFWDGVDIVIWIVAAFAGVVGILLCLETGGAGCLLTLLALILAALDVIAKMIDAAEKEGRKKAADDIERRLRDLERKIRSKGVG